MASKDLTFKDDERILCFHGPLLYEAKVLKGEWWDAKVSETGEEGPHYFVHYKGWKQTWDEWVPETRVLKWTDQNLKKQQELKQSHSSKRKTPIKSESSKAKEDDGNGVRNRKRARGDIGGTEKEEEYMKRPEIRIPIPETLKTQLVDDWENITKNQQLVPLPRSPNVNEIIDLYREHRKGFKDDQLTKEVIDGLKLYFNKTLGNLLLYRFERNQYVELRKNPGNEEKEMSEIYGGEHLLRLFVQMPGLIAHTNMDPESVAILREHLAEFLKFMQKNQKHFFLSEYENASPAYMSTAKAT